MSNNGAIDHRTWVRGDCSATAAEKEPRKRSRNRRRATQTSAAAGVRRNSQRARRKRLINSLLIIERVWDKRGGGRRRGRRGYLLAQHSGIMIVPEDARAADELLYAWRWERGSPVPAYYKTRRYVRVCRIIGEFAASSLSASEPRGAHRRGFHSDVPSAAAGKTPDTFLRSRSFFPSSYFYFAARANIPRARREDLVKSRRVEMFARTARTGCRAGENARQTELRGLVTIRARKLDWFFNAAN